MKKSFWLPIALGLCAYLVLPLPGLSAPLSDRIEQKRAVIEHAKQKLAKKGCDLIVANDVSAETGVMGGDSNTVHLVSASDVETWPTLSKTDVAKKLVERLGAMVGGRKP